jgi:two-component system response regulator LytT
MLKVLIIEDEPLAREELARLIEESVVPCKIIDELDSVEDALDWFNRNPQPDLIFVDIQLSDGVSFEIFKQIEISAPCIFTTAYQEYAIDAFKLNSIDYLLKPVHQDELDKALLKFKKLSEKESAKAPNSDKIDKIFEAVTLGSTQNNKSQFKERFLIKKGDSLIHVPVKEIAYLWAEDKLVFLKDLAGNRYVIDNSLDQIEPLLNPQKFFRISRAFIISIKSIQDIQRYFNSRLILRLNPAHNQEVIVARQRVKEFTLWLDQ